MKTSVSIAFAFLAASAPWSYPRAGAGLAHQGQKLDLAAAYALEGMFDEARPLLDAFPDKFKKTPGDDAQGYSPEANTAKRLALQWTLLHETLDPGKSDAFDLLVEVLAGQQCCSDEGNPVSSVLWQKVFARYAKREGYPVIGAYVLRRSSEYLGYTLEPEEAAEPAERATAVAQKDEVTRRSPVWRRARRLRPARRAPGPTGPARSSRACSRRPASSRSARFHWPLRSSRWG